MHRALRPFITAGARYFVHLQFFYMSGLKAWH